MGRDQSHRANLSSAIVIPFGDSRRAEARMTDDKWVLDRRTVLGKYQPESNSALSHGTRPIAQGQSVICYLSFVIPFGDSRMVSCPSARTLFRAGMLRSRKKYPRQPIARRRQHRPVECTG